MTSSGSAEVEKVVNPRRSQKITAIRQRCGASASIPSCSTASATCGERNWRSRESEPISSPCWPTSSSRRSLAAARSECACASSSRTARSFFDRPSMWPTTQPNTLLVTRRTPIITSSRASGAG